MQLFWDCCCNSGVHCGCYVRTYTLALALKDRWYLHSPLTWVLDASSVVILFPQPGLVHWDALAMQHVSYTVALIQPHRWNCHMACDSHCHVARGSHLSPLHLYALTHGKAGFSSLFLPPALTPGTACSFRNVHISSVVY